MKPKPRQNKRAKKEASRIHAEDRAGKALTKKELAAVRKENRMPVSCSKRDFYKLSSVISTHIAKNPQAKLPKNPPSIPKDIDAAHFKLLWRMFYNAFDDDNQFMLAHLSDKTWAKKASVSVDITTKQRLDITTKAVISVILKYVPDEQKEVCLKELSIEFQKAKLDVIEDSTVSKLVEGMER